MTSFPSLQTESFLAFIADNAKLGIHRAGYNGVAALIPRQSGNNLFVPLFAGLNYETISLAGLPSYESVHEFKFEPRREPVHIESAGESGVVLVQPETSHAHVSARITFTVEEPRYLHQRIELTFHRRFCAAGEPNRFDSLWASYMHMPPDRHLYLKADPRAGGDLEHWFGVTKTDHGAPEMLVRSLPANAEIGAADHLEAMKSQEPLADEDLAKLPQTEWAPSAAPSFLKGSGTQGPLHFYYGFCHDDLTFLQMFKEPERFRFAYSPCGGGKQPTWNPAWDYVLHLDDVKLDTPYTWDLCVAIKPYVGREDILGEVRRYREA